MIVVCYNKLFIVAKQVGQCIKDERVQVQNNIVL